MHGVTRRSLTLSLLLGVALGPACFCGGVPETDDGGANEPKSCIVNSDCGEDAHCADGFCIDGLAPGSCRDETDCEGEEICIFPEGSEIGACLNPHACDVDEDCDADQVCEDGDGDGFRDCIYPGCSGDEECAVELAGQCDDNDEPKCVARECVCRDRCGAPCGDGRQCCALPDTVATCINDLGPCGTFPCDPGYGGEASSFGDWSAPQCGYADEVCSCVELPPLPFGAIGNAAVLRSDPDGGLWVIAYNETYGDVVVGAVSGNGPVTDYAFVDGVPAVSADAPIVAGPSGPRGGVEAPGNDVGRALDAAFAADGTLYIVAEDATNGALRLIVGTPGGAFTSSVIDDEAAPGAAVAVIATSDDTLVVAAVARRTAQDTSVLRVYGGALPVATGADLERQNADTLLKTTVACEGGCAVGEVCVLAATVGGLDTCAAEGTTCTACAASQVCTLQGCRDEGTPAAEAAGLVVDALALAETPTALVVVGHDARAGALIGLRETGGDVTSGTATFTRVVIDDAGDDDVGNRPAALHDGTALVVASADVSNRRLTMHRLGATLTVLGTSTVDDGERPHPSGATSHHAVDVPALARDGAGRVVVAWQDGTVGAVRARVIEAGVLRPAQLVVGGALDVSYAGTLGLTVSAAGTASGLAVSARRLWLAQDPPISDVVVTDDLVSCPDDDVYEDNDANVDARTVAAPSAVKGIICGADDDDYFAIPLTAGCTVQGELIFDHDDGDLDLALQDAAGANLDQSLSTTDNEDVVATVTAAGTVVFRVLGFQAQENAYVLRIDTDCP